MINYIVPSDYIIGMFGHLAGKTLKLDFREICSFLHDMNQENPDVFNYVYDESQGFPYSEAVENGMRRLSCYFSEGDVFSNVRTITENCSKILAQDLFSKEEVKKLKDISVLFEENFAA